MFLFLLLLLMVLLSIAFFTLLERKILSYIQVRKGPNKMGLMGVLQPVIDGVKLFLKESSGVISVNKMLFQMLPLFMLLLMFMFWLCYCYKKFDLFLYSVVYFMLISSLSVYGLLGTGWASNSKYSVLGAYRSVAQVVSYEVGMVFLILILFIYAGNLNMKMLLLKNYESHLFFYGMTYFFSVWFVVSLAELNRAPFDFSESESELVSGFNVEFGSLKFALLFLSEYGNMIFMSYFTVCSFFSEMFFLLLVMMVKMVWVRGVFPRFRYDMLMMLNWKVYLPLILNFFFFVWLYKCL